MKDTKYQRLDDNSFVQLINGKKVAIFRIRNWMDGLLEEPDRHAGTSNGRTNRFQITQLEYQGNWE